ncbi:MAG: CBS domain-containing protein [Streptosporangiaceae bacterium]|jgi:CBS domain-containing protein
MTTLVRDVMTRNVVSLRQQAEFKEIVRVLRARQFSAFPVLAADDTVIGVVSEDDLLVREAYSEDSAPRFVLRHADRMKAAGLTAAELMTRPAITIGPAATVAEAARIMHARHVRRLPVVTAEGRLAGIVSRIDLLGVYDRPDTDIRQEVLDRIIDGEFMLDKLAFAVTVGSGVVTIRGPVDRQTVALSLLDAIRHVDGVLAVRDRLHYPHT